MNEFIIYHNTRCSKSREALELLKDNGIKPYIFEYLKTPLNYEELKSLSSHFEFKDFVRKSEAVFKELGLSIDDKEGVLKAMVKEPKLMQRPIVYHDGKAVIGRPTNNVFKLLQ